MSRLTSSPKQWGEKELPFGDPAAGPAQVWLPVVEVLRDVTIGICTGTILCLEETNKTSAVFSCDR